MTGSIRGAAENIPRPSVLYRSTKNNLFKSIGLDEYAGKRFSYLDATLTRGMDVFEGLGDPYREVEFMVEVNGRRVPKAYSTAQLLMLDREGWYESKHAIESILSNLASSGIVTRNRIQPFSSRVDQRVFTPEKFLTEFPWRTGSYDPQNDQILHGLPRPKRVTFVGLTPVAYDRSRFPIEAIVGAARGLLAAIEGLHRSSNSNVAFSPAVFMSMSPPDGAKENAFRQSRPPDMTSVIPFTNFNSKRLFDIEFGVSNQSCKLALNGPNHETWLNSLRSGNMYASRIFVPHGGGSNFLFNGRTGEPLRPIPDISDAMTDFAELVQLAQFMVDIKSHVLMHSCVMFHQYLLKRGYQNVNVQFGTDFNAVNAQLSQEENARAQVARNTIAAVSEAGFYVGTTLLGGNRNDMPQSRAQDNLSESTVPTLPLAVSRAVADPTGVGIPAALIAGMSALITYFASSDPPALHRETWTIVDRLQNDAPNGYSSLRSSNFYTWTWGRLNTGYTPKRVVDYMPVLRVR